MVSDRAKGNQYVLEAKEFYEKLGFLVWKPGSKALFIGPGRVVSQSQDIFEAFDLVATSIKEIQWIQVKSDESRACDARQLIDELPMPDGTIRVVLVRVKGKKHTFRLWLRIWGPAWTKPTEVSIKELN